MTQAQRITDLERDIIKLTEITELQGVTIKNLVDAVCLLKGHNDNVHKILKEATNGA